MYLHLYLAVSPILRPINNADPIEQRVDLKNETAMLLASFPKV